MMASENPVVRVVEAEKNPVVQVVEVEKNGVVIRKNAIIFASMGIGSFVLTLCSSQARWC